MSKEHLRFKILNQELHYKIPNLGHGEIYIDDDNSINLSADSSSSVGTSSIIFRTNGAEKVRIKEDKVGIGTDNPGRELTIYSPDSGSTYLNLTNATTGAGTNSGFALGLGGDEVARIWLSMVLPRWSLVRMPHNT